MKRIKQIIEALRVLGRTPSKSIISSWGTIVSAAKSLPGDQERLGDALALIDQFITEVVHVAEEMEAVKAEEPKS